MVYGVPTRLISPSWPVYWALCPVCEGKPATVVGTCPACDGAGCFLVPPGKPPPTAAELLTCAACDGTGKVYDKMCCTCQGSKRHFVHYREAELVEYRLTKDDFGVHITGCASSCKNGYTWLMAQCPTCRTVHPRCPVCLGDGWVPRPVADAIACYVRLLPPSMPREQVTRSIHAHLNDIGALIPHSAPMRRTA